MSASFFNFKHHIMSQEVSSVQSIKPLRDHVVVQAQGREAVTASGIVLPDTASKDKPKMGKVVAVGPGKMVDGSLVAMSLKVGDTILFSQYSPTEVKVANEEYLILREEDVFAVIN